MPRIYYLITTVYHSRVNTHTLSKRKRQAILFFTYGFMTLATIVISAICILLVLGYRFDIKGRTIEQGGLLQLRSTPNGATIKLDGVKQNFTTPGKTEVSAGSHTVVYERRGYHTWQKTISVDAGELRWLNYARFVPQTITTKQVIAADGTSVVLPTPDRKFMASITDQKTGVVEIYDLRDATKVTKRTITLPTDIVTRIDDQPGSYAIEEWDFGSRYVLLSYTYGTSKEYLRIDRTATNGDPYNLTTEFSLPFSSIHFSGTSGNVFYALTGHDLRRIDVGGKSVSQPIVTGVESYKLYRENDIAFVAVKNDKKIAGVYLNGKEHIVQSYALNDQLYVDITEYFSHYYLAIARGNHVEIIKDPAEGSQTTAGRSYASFPMAYQPAWFDFGSSGRFLIVGSGRAFYCYDLETDELTQGNTGETDTKLAAPKWLDDYYLVDNPSGTVRWYEFDGANRHDIVTADATLPAFLNDNGKYIVSFVRQGEKLFLQTSQVVLD